MKLSFGQIIKQLRKERGLSQSALAKEVQVSQQVFTWWETGLHEPKASHIIALALFFGVSTDYLLGLESEDGTPLLPEWPNP